MFRSRTGRLAAAGFAAASLLTVAVPAAQAQARPAAQVQARPAATWWLYKGEALLVHYAPAPLRTCAANGCSVRLYMPKSKGVYPGGGYVTSVKEQNYYNPYCEVNYKGVIGWVGCWRLALPTYG